MSIVVAISDVTHGNMYIPTDQANEAVVAHRTAWLSSLEIDPAQTTRVNISYDGDDFCRYRHVGYTDAGKGMTDGAIVPNDALITTTPGHALFLPVADCIAAAFYDEAHGVLMVSHLGRHSLEQQGGERSVTYLQHHFGTNPAALKVWLSPAVSKESYPITKLNGQGMKEAIHEQLHRAGVSSDHIIDDTTETDTDDAFFSHSAYLKGLKPTDGRFAMVAMITP